MTREPLTNSATLPHPGTQNLLKPTQATMSPLEKRFNGDFQREVVWDVQSFVSKGQRLMSLSCSDKR